MRVDEAGASVDVSARLAPWVRALLRVRADQLGHGQGSSGARSFVSGDEVRRLVRVDTPGPRAELREAVSVAWQDVLRGRDEAASTGEEDRLARLGRVLSLGEHETRLVGALAALRRVPVLREVALSLSGDPVVKTMTGLACCELVAAGDRAVARELMTACLPGGALARTRLVTGRGADPDALRGELLLDARVAAWLEGADPARLWTDPDLGGRLLVEAADPAALVVDPASEEMVRSGLAAAAQRAAGGALRLALVGSDPRIRQHLVHLLASPAGEPLLILNARKLGDGDTTVRGLARAARDASLLGAVVLLDDAGGLFEEPSAKDAQGQNANPNRPNSRQADPPGDAIVRPLEAHPGPVVFGLDKRQPALFRSIPALVEAVLPHPSATRKVAALAAALGGSDDARRVAELVAPRYAMDQDVIEAAASEARRLAGDEAISTATVALAVRRQLESRIGDFADSVELTHSLEDIELPEEARRSLEELITAYAARDKVLDTWGFGERISNARGVSGLFHGPPGTGKTMAAGVVARELGTEVYKVDLSRVVDKYIGETEKHLERIFDEAERGQVVLLFDEADSLFSKRTEVKRSTDRYSNLEVNFLLQRLERHDGVVILTTNHDALIDEAFKRRIRYHVHFPLPGPEERTRLWRRLLPAVAPLEDDVDFEDLGEWYEMSGGHIRNASMRAAYAAAAAGTRITHTTLVDAANAEYRSLGKLVRDLE